MVDQTYVNNKINTPQADVVRLTADLQRVDGVWKISDVTVLEGATSSASTARAQPAPRAGAVSLDPTVPGQ